MRVFVALSVAAGLIGCADGTTSLSTKPVQMSEQEVFRIKNTLAEQTKDPGGAAFRNVYAMHLSNGDTVYCGEMDSVDETGRKTGFTPFYLRQRGEVVKAINWLPRSATFSSTKCEEARAGTLRINNV